LLKSAKRARLTWGEKPKIVELSAAVPATIEVLSQAQAIEPQDKARWLEAKKLKSVRLGTFAIGEPNASSSSRGAPSAATAATPTIKPSHVAAPLVSSTSSLLPSLSSSSFDIKTVHRRKKRLPLSLIKSIRLENNQAKAIKMFW